MGKKTVGGLLVAALMLGSGWGCGNGATKSSSSLNPVDFKHNADDEAKARAQADELIAARQHIAKPAEEPATKSPAPAPAGLTITDDLASNEPLPPEGSKALAEAADKLLPTDKPAPPVDSKSAFGKGTLTLDAKVGEINGKPVYASEMFREIGEEQLVFRGKELDRLEFRKEVYQDIRAVLRSKILDSMTIAESENRLTENEKLGLLGYLKKQREVVLAEYGGGVQSVAERELRSQRGHGVEEELERRRKRLLFDKLLDEKLRAKVEVTRKEIERYYQDHSREFNPTPSVTVRVIVVRDEATAVKVEAALAGGEKFESVAKKYSVFRAADGGLMPAFQLKGSFEEFNELSWKELNEKVRKLKPGEQSDRTKIGENYGWVMLEKLETGKSRTLQEAYLGIENALRSSKYKKHQDRYFEDLILHGNYTPVDQMSQELLEIAMDRYARAQ